MRFKYVASSAGGQISKGVIDASNREVATQELQANGFTVIGIKAGRPELQDLKDYFVYLTSGTISHMDRTIFTKHLSLMLRSGLTVAEALDILIEQSSHPGFTNIIRRMRDRVRSGETLAFAMSRFPRVFAKFYVNIVTAGEVSGSLEENLTHLATQMTKEHEIQQRVKSALLYPTVVVVGALAIGYFFAIYVIPQVARLFEGLSGVELPALTVGLIAIAGFAKEHSLSSFVILFGGFAFLYWFLRLPLMNPITHWVNLRLPIVGKIVRNVNLARFSLVLATMLRSGIDIITATDISGQVVDNYYYKKALVEATAQMQRGRTMSDSLGGEESNSRIFPKVTTRMIGVGERTGKLEDVLTYLTEFYQLEVETTMRNLATLLEPILLIIIGIIALLLALSILMPIYGFINQISAI